MIIETRVYYTYIYNLSAYGLHIAACVFTYDIITLFVLIFLVMIHAGLPLEYVKSR